MPTSVLAATSSSNDVSGAEVAIFVTIAVVLSLLFIVPYVVGLWKVLEKAGRPGWGALVPIYNNWLIIDVVGRPGWWLLMLFIPYASIVFAVILMIDLAKSFGRSTGFGVGLAFLGPVFMLILGVGDATYRGPSVLTPAGAAVHPPGWYPDPWNQAPYRWWDGRTWTAHTA